MFRVTLSVLYVCTLFWHLGSCECAHCCLQSYHSSSKNILPFIGIIRVQFMFLSARSSLAGFDRKNNAFILQDEGAGLMLWFQGEMWVSVAPVRDLHLQSQSCGAWWHWNLCWNSWCVLTLVSPKCKLKANRVPLRTSERVTQQRWGGVERRGLKTIKTGWINAQINIHGKREILYLTKFS